MKIGLFFGTFNPIHMGHLMIAHYIQEFSDLDQVWFVVSPMSPFKQHHTLANDYERLQMVRLAIENYPSLRASDIEFKMPKPNYTIDTLVQLKEDYPKHEFSLIMGEDNLTHLHKWKNAEVLIANHSIYVYPRLHPQTKAPKIDTQKVTKLEAPVVELSSTFIREAIKNQKNVRAFLPPEVFEYIDGSALYQN